jgi:anti-anti-sigma regulatory factor
VEGNSPTQLLVDFSQVEYCSTAIISALLRARKTIVAEGGQVRFWGMRENVREAFRMLNLDGSIFDIHETSGSALAAF